MCPDPFDYSGPVANGAVTQNDFAARSNGTRPVRSTPLPWPPLVESSPRRPTPAEETPDTVVVAAATEPEIASVAVVAEPVEIPAEPDPVAGEAPVTGSVTLLPDAPAPVKTPPGVVPPKGRWMTEDRRLPPPGNVDPPSTRRPEAPAGQPGGWRAAARSLIGR